MKKAYGFTLTELMAVLALLAVIAMFTIPKILNTSTTNTWTAQAKEEFSMISQAYLQYKFENGMEVSNAAANYSTNLTNVFNYVAVDSTTVIDHVPGQTSVACSLTTAHICLKMHSGGMLLIPLYNHFGVADANHYVYFLYDPDGRYSGSATGKGKSITVDLHYDGGLYTGDQRTGAHDTYAFGVAQGYGVEAKSDWFSW